MGMRIVLKGKEILERSGFANTHQLALKAQVSYPTVHRYITDAENLTNINLEALAAILLKGCGMSPAELENIRLGDLFEVVVD